MTKIKPLIEVRTKLCNLGSHDPSVLPTRVATLDVKLKIS